MAALGEEAGRGSLICISAWLPCSFLGKAKKNPQWVTNYAWTGALTLKPGEQKHLGGGRMGEY